jgi:tetratricopeptide (TPR) repeat protein
MWKKKTTIDLAINYYKKALQLDPKNKTALRSLSMIIRTKETQSLEEKQKIAQESLDFAKKAITLDMSDGFSWYIYGNAFFYKAFIDKTQYKDLRLALSAYNKAQDKVSKYKNPDLFYNRGVVHAYLEDYQNAFNDFNEAHKIDETLGSDKLCKAILEIVKSTSKSIKNMCGLKPKKLAQILTTIPHKLKDDVKYELMKGNEFIEGKNINKLITGKIIAHVKSSFDVPISFVCVDYSSNFFCLSVYNISTEFVNSISYMTSTFVVLEPDVKKISMVLEEDGNEKKIEYFCIQVSELNSLLVDGKFCSGYGSSSTLNSTFFN